MRDISDLLLSLEPQRFCMGGKQDDETDTREICRLSNVRFGRLLCLFISIALMHAHLQRHLINYCSGMMSVPRLFSANLKLDAVISS